MIVILLITMIKVEKSFFPKTLLDIGILTKKFGRIRQGTRCRISARNPIYIYSILLVHMIFNNKQPQHKKDSHNCISNKKSTMDVDDRQFLLVFLK